MTKQEIRKHRLEARRAMPPEDVATKSHAIANRLEALPIFADASLILCYVASKDNEVDTHHLIRASLARGTTILVPIAQPQGRMIWSELRALDELTPARFNILEPSPQHRRITKPPTQAPVIVPGVAFNPEGHRIGYGGGYYDRFLATHTGPTIALAYDIQITAPWQTANHDIPIDIIITESRTYRGGRL